MIGKILSMGFGVATMPARVTLRSVRALSMSSAEFTAFAQELRQASDEAVLEVQNLIAGVDAEMSHKAGHLTNEQKQQAAALALYAAEKHLSMAAVNVLRAIWLSTHAANEIKITR